MREQPNRNALFFSASALSPVMQPPPQVSGDHFRSMMEPNVGMPLLMHPEDKLKSSGKQKTQELPQVFPEKLDPNMHMLSPEQKGARWHHQHSISQDLQSDGQHGQDDLAFATTDGGSNERPNDNRGYASNDPFSADGEPLPAHDVQRQPGGGGAPPHVENLLREMPSIGFIENHASMGNLNSALWTGLGGGRSSSTAQRSLRNSGRDELLGSLHCSHPGDPGHSGAAVAHRGLQMTNNPYDPLLYGNSRQSQEFSTHGLQRMLSSEQTNSTIGRAVDQHSQMQLNWTSPYQNQLSNLQQNMRNQLAGFEGTFQPQLQPSQDLSPQGEPHVAAPASPRKATKRRRAKTFPQKFMDTLIKHASDDAVKWLPDGRSFLIVDDTAFVEKVLSHDFKASKYSSFVRKLHRWGFVRITSGAGKDCFHHPLFQRDRCELAGEITAVPHLRQPPAKRGRQDGSGQKSDPEDTDIGQGVPENDNAVEIPEPDPFPPDTEDLGPIDDVWDSDD